MYSETKITFDFLSDTGQFGFDDGKTTELA